MLNKVMLIGHVGRDPELKYTPSGTAVAKFSLATSEKYGKGDQRKEKTTWHNVVAWQRLAEVVGEYCRKGTLVYLEGRLDRREWEDKDGAKRTRWEIVANTMQMLGKAPARPAGNPDDAVLDQFAGEPGGWSDDEDVPF